MNKETLKALRESIAHWKRLATGKRREGEHIGTRDCALCNLFLAKQCVGCPVAKSTGTFGCVETPYGKAAAARAMHGFDSPEFKSAARKELAFLQSLLPERKAKR